VTRIDRVQDKVEKRLLNLGRVELSLELFGSGDIKRNPLISRVCTGDSGNVVQGIGEIPQCELGGARTRVEEKIGGQPFKARGFLGSDRKHFLALLVVLARPHRPGERTGDHRDRVPDLVSQCAGQSPHRSEFSSESSCSRVRASSSRLRTKRSSRARRLFTSNQTSTPITP